MPIEIMFLTGTGLLVLVFSGYYLLGFLKGSIKIRLPKISYVPGEVVKGKIRLHAKQAIVGSELVVCLVAKEVTKQYDSDGDKTVRECEIYRDGILLAGPTQYSKGFIKDYVFELGLPSPEDPIMIKPSLSQTVASVVIKAVIGRGRGQLVWSVEAILDAEGVDLSGTERIYIK